MKLLPTYATSDAGNLVRDGYFDTETGTRYAVREGVRYVMSPATLKGSRAWSVVAYTGPGEDAVPMAHLSRAFEHVDDALAELDRIAALIDGTAPAQAQEWVKGPPPENDGQWFLAMVKGGDPVAVVCCAGCDLPWSDTAGNDYPSSEFTHHLPTPIQPPKES